MTSILEEALQNLCGVQDCMNSAKTWYEMVSLVDLEDSLYKNPSLPSLRIMICDDCWEKVDV